MKLKKKKKADLSRLDEDVIHNLNTSLANEFGMVKTKLMNLEAQEKHQEEEMNEARMMILDQQNLIKYSIEGY